MSTLSVGSNLHSGTPLDGLLRVVLELGGDRLHLATGRAPEALSGTRPLRLTMPATSNSMLRAVCGDMVALHERAPSQESTYRYATANGEHFEVQIRGALSDSGTATVRVTRAKAALPTVQVETRPPAPVAPAPEPRARAPLDTARAEHNALLVSEQSGTSPNQNPQSLALPPAFRGLVERALASGASDLHLAQREPPCVRIAGRLRALDEAPLDPGAFLSASQLDRVNAGHALDLAFSLGSTRLRMNVFLAEPGITAAVRLLWRSPPALSSLGLPEEVMALTGVPHGLVLFCGQTGAGKSTTLAALAETLLNRTPCLGISLESPIEYQLTAPLHSRIRQREVGRHVTSFATGLRDALREDPDFLLIGEMRDPETIALALTAAETGHLVLSSLHSRSATSAIERIVDGFPGHQQHQVRIQLADSLRAVVSQRLLPTVRGDNRVVAAEVLTVNTAVAHLIREGKTAQIPSVLHTGKHAGMIPLERELARLVQAGRVQRALARTHAGSVDLFDQLC
jgi:twitching motility protein PilT